MTRRLSHVALLLFVPSLLLVVVALVLAVPGGLLLLVSARSVVAGLRRRAAADRPQCTGAGTSRADAVRSLATRTQAGRQADAQPREQSLGATAAAPSAVHPHHPLPQHPAGAAFRAPAPPRPAVFQIFGEHEC